MKWSAYQRALFARIRRSWEDDPGGAEPLTDEEKERILSELLSRKRPQLQRPRKQVSRIGGLLVAFSMAGSIAAVVLFMIWQFGTEPGFQALETLRSDRVMPPRHLSFDRSLTHVHLSDSAGALSGKLGPNLFPSDQETSRYTLALSGAVENGRNAVFEGSLTITNRLGPKPIKRASDIAGIRLDGVWIVSGIITNPTLERVYLPR